MSSQFKFGRASRSNPFNSGLQFEGTANGDCLASRDNQRRIVLSKGIDEFVVIKGDRLHGLGDSNQFNGRIGSQCFLRADCFVGPLETLVAVLRISSFLVRGDIQILVTNANKKPWLGGKFLGLFHDHSSLVRL